MLQMIYLRRRRRASRKYVQRTDQYIPDAVERPQKRRSGQLLLLKQSYSRTEAINVVRAQSFALSIDRDHIDSSLCCECVEPYVRGAFDVNHVILAGRTGKTLLLVVVEKAIQTPCIHEHIRGIDDTKAPRLLARISRAISEVRVGIGWIRCKSSA